VAISPSKNHSHRRGAKDAKDEFFISAERAEMKMFASLIRNYTAGTKSYWYIGQHD
jgi:hypothetical protein